MTRKTSIQTHDHVDLGVHQQDNGDVDLLVGDEHLAHLSAEQKRHLINALIYLPDLPDQQDQGRE